MLRSLGTKCFPYHPTEVCLAWSCCRWQPVRKNGIGWPHRILWNSSIKSQFCAHAHTRAHTRTMAHTRTHVHICVHANTHTHTHTHARTHARTHAHTHTHTPHTHTQLLSSPPPLCSHTASPVGPTAPSSPLAPSFPVGPTPPGAPAGPVSPCSTKSHTHWVKSAIMKLL